MSAILLRFLPYIVSLGVGLGIGGYLVGNHWEAKYEALQAGHAQEVADAQQKAKEAIQAQLEQFQNVSANNDRVIHELQSQADSASADSARDRDLVQRLLHAAQRDPRYHTVPEADHQSGATPTSQTPGDGSIGELLVAAAAECRANARQLNALSQEIRPQL